MIDFIFEPYFLIVFAIMMVTVVIAIAVNASKVSKLKRYMDISIGMSENEMLSIMGSGYSKSLLKNNRTKYEWKINATSYGSSYKGMSTRSYSGVKKVTIYCKNGLVEEVKTLNLQN